MTRGPFCWAVIIPKTVLELARDAGLRSGGAALMIKVCAFPPDEKMVRLSALKKFAWICRSNLSKILVRLDTERSSSMYAGMRSAEIRLGAFPKSPEVGIEKAAGLM